MQAVVHELDPTGYSPEQAALVQRARHEFPTIQSGVGLMAQALMDRIIRDIDGPYDDQYLERWRQIGMQQAAFGYFHAPPWDQMQIEHVIICYLQVVQGQNDYQEELEKGEITAVTERRLNATQTRYHRALESLARVRRLMQPMPLQINIGGQQVNVAGDTVPAMHPEDSSILDMPRAPKALPTVNNSAPSMAATRAERTPASRRRSGRRPPRT